MRLGGFDLRGCALDLVLLYGFECLEMLLRGSILAFGLCIGNPGVVHQAACQRTLLE